MKKLNSRLLSLILILIFTSVIFCACAAKSYDSSPSESIENKYTSGSSIASPESSSQSSAIDTERKIIKTVSITAETKKFDETVENINKLCADMGGYVETSTVTGNSINVSSQSRSASFTLRIPADKLDDFTGDVEDSVNVTNIKSNSEEITESYYDAVARLSVLEAQRESLQKMYDSFDDYSDMDDMLAVQDKLYDVIEEIESYKARINSYDNKVEYSTVYINIYEVLEYTPVSTPKSFGEKFVSSFKNGWINFWAGCQNFAVWFAGAIPTLIIIAGITVAAIFIVKKIYKTAKAKKTECKSKKIDSEDESKTE